eukprot:508241-Rhodomonas_salina.2
MGLSRSVTCMGLKRTTTLSMVQLHTTRCQDIQVQVSVPTLARDRCTGRSSYNTGVSRVVPCVPPVSSSISRSVVAAQNEESRQTLISECVECLAT